MAFIVPVSPLGPSELSPSKFFQTVLISAPLVSATVSATGVSITSTAGTVTDTGDANVSVSGVSITSTVGTVTESGGATVATVGVSITSTAGTVTDTGDANVSATGSLITSTAGSAILNAVISATGLSITSAAGTVILETDVSFTVSGTTIIGTAGTVQIPQNVSVSVTGSTITSSVGSVIVVQNVAVSVTGNTITSTAGSAIIADNVSVSVTGNIITSSVNTVAVIRPFVPNTVPGRRVISTFGASATNWTEIDSFSSGVQLFTRPGVSESLFKINRADDWERLGRFWLPRQRLVMQGSGYSFDGISVVFGGDAFVPLNTTNYSLVVILYQNVFSESSFQSFAVGSVNVPVVPGAQVFWTAVVPYVTSPNFSNGLGSQIQLSLGVNLQGTSAATPRVRLMQFEIWQG